MLSHHISTPGNLRPTEKTCRVFRPRGSLLLARQHEMSTRTHCRLVAAAASSKDSNTSNQGLQVPPTQWRLFTCRMPLVGLEGVAAALEGLPSTKPVARLLNLHTYLLLESPNGGVWSFDFLPLNPTATTTALVLLTGGRAPGELRVRKLSVQQVKQNNKIRLLGLCCHTDPLEAAAEYNRSYDKGLHLLINNCTHHTNGMSKVLLTSAEK